jgi:hypothetical protein
MSLKILSRVFDTSAAEVGDRLTIIALADSAHDDGITWVSQEEIARKTLLSVRHVRRCLDALEKLGEIETRKAQRGRRRINVYRVTAALEDPDYDRLPFVLTEPFTTGHHVPSSVSDDRTFETGRPDISDTDDRTSETLTTGHLVHAYKEEPEVLTVRGPVSEPAPRGASDPPPVKLVDGENLPLNALAETCHIDKQNRQRMREAGVALNGAKGKPDGIRDYFWIEYQRVLDAGGLTDAPSSEAFDEALIEAIKRKATRYRRALPGAVLTPHALRKWWLDLKPEQGGVLTGDDLRGIS